MNVIVVNATLTSKVIEAMIRSLRNIKISVIFGKAKTTVVMYVTLPWVTLHCGTVVICCNNSHVRNQNVPRVIKPVIVVVLEIRLPLVILEVVNIVIVQVRVLLKIIKPVIVGLVEVELPMVIRSQ
ncbi:hypothetical protein QAD02_019389 [Eretmocerus hayati]|uniref:Uncharacterized protein n=1 Tax=Eretmocerus hayati TaxID=131215 RepID=A0ACC2PJG0_9HYME|nr:hypothetical protein QAD02_019389 [Eretmocerus hayati]